MHRGTKKAALIAANKLVKKLKASPEFGRIEWGPRVHRTAAGWYVSAASKDECWEVEHIDDYSRPGKSVYEVSLGRRKDLETWWSGYATSLEKALRKAHNRARKDIIEMAACIGTRIVPIMRKTP